MTVDAIGGCVGAFPIAPECFEVEVIIYQNKFFMCDEITCLGAYLLTLAGQKHHTAAP